MDSFAHLCSSITNDIMIYLQRVDVRQNDVFRFIDVHFNKNCLWFKGYNLKTNEVHNSDGYDFIFCHIICVINGRIQNASALVDVKVHVRVYCYNISRSDGNSVIVKRDIHSSTSIWTRSMCFKQPM